jgi:hypothetical protein
MGAKAQPKTGARKAGTGGLFAAFTFLLEN